MHPAAPTSFYPFTATDASRGIWRHATGSKAAQMQSSVAVLLEDVLEDVLDILTDYVHLRVNVTSQA